MMLPTEDALNEEDTYGFSHPILDCVVNTIYMTKNDSRDFS